MCLFIYCIFVFYMKFLCGIGWYNLIWYKFRFVCSFDIIRLGGFCLKVFGELICKCCIDNIELFFILVYKLRFMVLLCLLIFVKVIRV